jgi:hypothetical protein
MNTAKFEIGQSYGNDLTMEIISRTEKTATIKTVFGTQKIKIRSTNKNEETILFKCWSVGALDVFNEKEAQEIAYYNAYCK